MDDSGAGEALKDADFGSVFHGGFGQGLGLRFVCKL